MTRAFIVTLCLLLAALGWIMYREATLRQAADGGAIASELWAEMEARNTAERDAQKLEHAAELASIQADLTDKLTAAEREIETLSAGLDRERRRRVADARKGPAELKAAVVDVARTTPDQVSVTDTHVDLTHEAAIGWINLTLTFQNDLHLCDSNCAVSLARQKLEIVPQLTESRQMAEQDALRLTGENEVLQAKNLHLVNQLRASDGKVLQWTLTAAAIALVVGFGGGVAAGYSF